MTLSYDIGASFGAEKPLQLTTGPFILWRVHGDGGVPLATAVTIEKIHLRDNVIVQSVLIVVQEQFSTAWTE